MSWHRTRREEEARRRRKRRRRRRRSCTFVKIYIETLTWHVGKNQS
jgi:hypothetical protein